MIILSQRELKKSTNQGLKEGADANFIYDVKEDVNKGWDVIEADRNRGLKIHQQPLPGISNDDLKDPQRKAQWQAEVIAFTHQHLGEFSQAFLEHYSQVPAYPLLNILQSYFLKDNSLLEYLPGAESTNPSINISLQSTGTDPNLKNSLCYETTIERIKLNNGKILPGKIKSRCEYDGQLRAFVLTQIECSNPSLASLVLGSITLDNGEQVEKMIKKAQKEELNKVSRGLKKSKSTAQVEDKQLNQQDYQAFSQRGLRRSQSTAQVGSSIIPKDKAAFITMCQNELRKSKNNFIKDLLKNDFKCRPIGKWTTDNATHLLATDIIRNGRANFLVNHAEIPSNINLKEDDKAELKQYVKKVLGDDLGNQLLQNYNQVPSYIAWNALLDCCSNEDDITYTPNANREGNRKIAIYAKETTDGKMLYYQTTFRGIYFNNDMIFPWAISSECVYKPQEKAFVLTAIKCSNKMLRDFLKKGQFKSRETSKTYQSLNAYIKDKEARIIAAAKRLTTEYPREKFLSKFSTGSSLPPTDQQMRQAALCKQKVLESYIAIEKYEAGKITTEEQSLADSLQQLIARLYYQIEIGKLVSLDTIKALIIRMAKYYINSFKKEDERQLSFFGENNKNDFPADAKSYGQIGKILDKLWWDVSFVETEFGQQASQSSLRPWL